MIVSPLDNVFFSGILSTPEMRQIFEEKNYVQKMLDVEAALAYAEAELGMIPAEAAKEIAEKADVNLINFEEVRKLLEKTGHFVMAIIISWSKILKNGEYIHWGVTSQDITDTATVLLIRDAYALILNDLKIIKDHLSNLAIKYKDTPIVGRTHITHAVPMTFGLKVAVWLDEINRHHERFNEMKKRLFVGNITGAVGTLASFDHKGLDVQRLTLERLGLNIPSVSWHSARDVLGEFINGLALAASTLSKIAQQILILMRPEIFEIEEPIPPGAIGSSTMPQKKNPKLSERTIALTRILRGFTVAMSEAIETIDERSFSTQFSEFIIIPESCLLMSAILRNMKTILGGLVVHPENMEKNLSLSKGLINSERVMIALGKYIGRQTAHEVIYHVTMKAWEENRSFEEMLLEDDTIKKFFSAEEIKNLCNPLTYLGCSSQIVEMVVNKIKTKEVVNKNEG